MNVRFLISHSEALNTSSWTCADDSENLEEAEYVPALENSETEEQ